MGKAGTVKVEVHPVSLKFVTLVVPKNEKKKSCWWKTSSRWDVRGCYCNHGPLRARRWRRSSCRSVPTSGRAPCIGTWNDGRRTPRQKFIISGRKAKEWQQEQTSE